MQEKELLTSSVVPLQETEGTHKKTEKWQSRIERLKENRKLEESILRMNEDFKQNFVRVSEEKDQKSSSMSAIRSTAEDMMRRAGLGKKNEPIVQPLITRVHPSEFTMPKDPKRRNEITSIYFGNEAFQQAQFLIGKGVRLEAWIELSYIVFEEYLKSDLRISQRKTKESSVKDFIKNLLRKGFRDLDSCKSYAHIVMANFFDFCFQESLHREFAYAENSVTPEELGLLFSRQTVEKISYLMNHDVRLDLWIKLCHISYSYLWGANEGQRQTTLTKEQKSKAFERIRALAAKDGEFWLMPSTRIAEFMASFLYPNNPGGIPEERASTR